MVLTNNIIRHIILQKINTIRCIILFFIHRAGEFWKKPRPLPEYKGGERMIFNTGAALLDAIVLAIVAKEDAGTYGYKITQDVRAVIEISESTLYPVLRRLLKDECLEVYDQETAGRNRRYYRITEQGRRQLSLYQQEWAGYSSKINGILLG